MTSQAMPIEMRMPVRMVGRSRGQDHAQRRGARPHLQRLATLSHSRRTLATPNAVLISIGPDRADEDDEDRRDTGVLDV